MKERPCPRCGETDESKFSKNARTKDGLQSWCKACFAAYYTQNHIAMRLYASQRHARLSGYAPPSYIEEDIEEALFLQQGVCVACAGFRGPLGDNWHLEHDHVTGRFRGLVHPGCNVALGMINDDPQALRALADFLESKNLYERIDDVLKRQETAA